MDCKVSKLGIILLRQEKIELFDQKEQGEVSNKKYIT
jgi:hypothetical protein